MAFTDQWNNVNKKRHYIFLLIVLWDFLKVQVMPSENVHLKKDNKKKFKQYIIHIL